LFEGLHKFFYLVLMICLQDQDEGVLPVQDGVSANIHAELAGVCGVQVGKQKTSHLGVLSGAGLGIMLVAYKKEGHFDLL
jgi:hypothetical protein